MTWLDIAVVASILLAGAYGFWKGIVRAVVSVAGLLGGLVLAGTYYPHLALALWPAGEAWTKVAAFAIILIAILVLAAMVAAFLFRLVHMTPLGIVDRVLGLAAGLLIVGLGWALLLSLVFANVPGAHATLIDSSVAITFIRWLAAIRGLPAPDTGSI
jgi:membrane protein required for colicin V production